MLRALIFFLLFCAVPTLASATGAAHTGDVTRRTMPELSDIALAAMAAFAVWLAQRAMRRRARQARRAKLAED